MEVLFAILDLGTVAFICSVIVSDFSSLRVFEEVVADGIPNEGGVIGKEGGIGD